MSSLSVSESDQTPLLSALLGCSQQTQAPFFTPGHKLGRGIFSPLLQAWGSAVFSCDLPELPELDNLFAPEGVIAIAQILAAETFGADVTWFLVNGSTVGIMAAILATGSPGDRIIMPRTVHRSAIAGCILAGVEPIFITPPYHPEWDLPIGLTPEQVTAALSQFPDARAVLLVSPTYQGIVADVAAIAEICHQHNIPLIVDAAHGAHLGFHPDLPPSPLSLGADLVVQSTHKVLSALTQAAMLHLKGDRVSRDRLNRALQLLQTSSPSYLLLASLDAARSQMATQGKALMSQTLDLSEIAHAGIQAISGLNVLKPDTLTHLGMRLDPTRLTLDLSAWGITGFAADDYLREKHQVVAELPTLTTLTFMISLGNQESDIQLLLQGLQALAGELERSATKFRILGDLKKLSQQWYRNYPEVSTLSTSLRESFFATTTVCPVAEAIGQVSAELICPYPPGIPVLMPGERITESAIAYLQQIATAGGLITGCQDPSLQTLAAIASR